MSQALLVLCPVCGASVPESNLILHQRLCNRSRTGPPQNRYPAPDPQHAREAVRDAAAPGRAAVYPSVDRRFAVESIRPSEPSASPVRNSSGESQFPRAHQAASAEPQAELFPEEMDADLARAIELSLRESEQNSQTNFQNEAGNGSLGGQSAMPGPWRCRACGAQNADPFELTCEMCNTTRQFLENESLSSEDSQPMMNMLLGGAAVGAVLQALSSAAQRRSSRETVQAAAEGAVQGGLLGALASQLQAMHARGSGPSRVNNTGPAARGSPARGPAVSQAAAAQAAQAAAAQAAAARRRRAGPSGMDGLAQEQALRLQALQAMLAALASGEQEMDDNAVAAMLGMPHQTAAAATDIQNLPTETLSEEGVRRLRGAEQAQCVVCMDDFAPGDDVKRLPCLHAFHGGCVDRWLQRSGLCPVCKHRV